MEQKKELRFARRQPGRCKQVPFPLSFLTRARAVHQMILAIFQFPQKRNNRLDGGKSSIAIYLQEKALYQSY